jgi:hypothetical protein
MLNHCIALRVFLSLLCSRDRLTVLASKKDDPTDQIFVFWAEEEKLGVAPIKKSVSTRRRVEPVRS